MELWAALIGALIGGAIALAASVIEGRREFARQTKLLLWQEATEILNLLRAGRHAALKARRTQDHELTLDEKQAFWLSDVGIFMLPGSGQIESEVLTAISATRSLLDRTASPDDEWTEALDNQKASSRALELAVRRALGERS